MRRKQFTYFIKFYFYAILFFIEDVFFKDTDIAPELIYVQPIPAEINLLDMEEGVVSEKPSQADVLANQARLGLAGISKKYRKKLIIGLIVAAYFILFGAANTIYWLAVIIKKYNAVGWALLFAVSAGITYLLSMGIYRYFKNKKYQEVLVKIKKALFDVNKAWQDSKIKAAQKLQNSII